VYVVCFDVLCCFGVLNDNNNNNNGGLGVRSAMMLAPSAFLASAASTLQLQQSILPEGISQWFL